MAPSTFSEKRRRRSSVAVGVPTELVVAHGGLNAVDTLLLLTTLNPENRYVVVEALAGCGKTAMLTALVRRVNQKNAILLLSFTNQAITVATLRVPDGMHAQTFDSLFFQTVRHGVFKNVRAEMTAETFTYEQCRDLSQTLSEADLANFVGLTSSKYDLARVRYVLVDEAQDTPPQAYHLLERFRAMGKTVVITGDRHQAIFGFMQTQSLFDAIPSKHKVVHHLRETKRCCPHVVDFLNNRFGLRMRSAYDSESGPDAIDSVCVQALYNATLGRLYAKFLLGINTPVQIQVSEGDSTVKFWDAAHAETARIYSVPTDRAQVILRDRASVLDKAHRRWGQMPVGWRPFQLTFSTVHHFKGGECDITILAQDVALCERTTEALTEDERMKYVAASRPRWGIVDLGTLRWIGHPLARKHVNRQFLEQREPASPGTAPRVASVTDLPCAIVALILSPPLDPWTARFRQVVKQAAPLLPCPPTLPKASQAMKAGTIAGILVNWRVERLARQNRCPHVHVRSPELQVQPRKDRKYLRLSQQGHVSPEMDLELRRIVARLKLQAVFGRCLAVLHGWRLTSPLLLRAASAKSRLQSFMLCFSVLSLRPDFLDLPTRAKIGAMTDETTMPGILGRPDTWVSVNLQQTLPHNPVFFLRGSSGMLIVDRNRQAHLVEVKAVRSLQPSHVLQALLHTTILYIALGSSLTWRTGVYELNRNELCAFDPEPLLRMDPALLSHLDSALHAKVLPQYYPSDLSIDAIMSLL